MTEEHNELLKALGEITCPECNHSLHQHVYKFGCEFDLGDGYRGDAEFQQALGPCSCEIDSAVFPEFRSAVELLRRLK